jgi:hypothetical protein
MVEVQNAGGFGAELRVARFLPVLASPGSEMGLLQPAVQGGATGGRAEFFGDLPGEFGEGEAREVGPLTRGQFAGEGRGEGPILERVDRGVARSRPIAESFEAVVDKSVDPGSGGAGVDSKLGRDRVIIPSSMGEDDDLGSDDFSMRSGSTSGDSDQIVVLLSGEADARLHPSK